MKIRRHHAGIALVLAGLFAFAGFAIADFPDDSELCDPTGFGCLRDIPPIGPLVQDVVITPLYVLVTGFLGDDLPDPPAGGGDPGAGQGGIAACVLNQNTDACAQAFPGLASRLSDCPPSEEGIDCAYNALREFAGADQLVSVISEILAACQTAPVNTVCDAVRSSGGAPDRVVVLSEAVSRGNLAYTEGAAALPSGKTIDGNPADWSGQATRIGGTEIIHSGEHIYTDYLFDAFGADAGEDARRLAALALAGQVSSRTDRVDALQTAAGDQLGVPQPAGSRSDHYGDATNREDGLDLTEIRWGANSNDSTHLFFLARVAKLETAANFVVLILADTSNATSGMAGLNAGLNTGKFDRAVVLSSTGGQTINLVDGTTSALETGSVAVNASGYTNALEARIPRAALANQDGSLRVAVMTARKVGNTYIPSNVAYRFDEPVTIYSEQAQALSLFARNVDGFATTIALNDLTGGRTQAARPGPGYHERQFTSGDNISAENDSENGRFQPYGLFVPTGAAAAPLANRLTFWLHYRGGKTHSGAAATPRLITQLGEEQNNIVVTPRARGTSTWYTTRSHQDFFEVFADIAGTNLLKQYAAENLPANHGFSSTGLFNIDPSRVYLSGYSMGGYATYLFGGLYPDLFAAGYSTSGAVTQGAWTGIGPEPGQPGTETCGFIAPDDTPEIGGGSPCFIEANSGRANAQLNYRLLENTRHMPLTIHHGTNDELALTPGAVRMGQRLLELRYRYDMTTFLGYEHFTQAIVDEWRDGAHYLNLFARPENPRAVTYKVVPALVKAINEVQLNGVNGNQPFQFHPDGAYWVDGLVVRVGANGADPTQFGMIDAQSDKLPADNHVAVPRTGASADPAYVSTPVFSPGNHSTPYVRHGLDWQVTGPAPTSDNRFSATLTNLSAATLDLGRMAINLDTRADGVVTSDGPVNLSFSNVARTVRVYVNEFERPSAVQGSRIMLALSAADLPAGVAHIQFQPVAETLAYDPSARPDIVALCRSQGPELQALCDSIASVETQLLAGCRTTFGENGQFCSVLGGSLYGIVDACRGVQPNLLCKVADTFLESFASSCRQIEGASPDFCALLSRERIAADEIDAYEQGWTHRALSLQYELGAPLAFVDALFPATHNSFNSTNANDPQTLSGSDANQRYGVVDQLRMGIRAIEIDVHWMPRSDGTGFGPTVCHGNAFHFGCTYEKGLADELQDVRAWLDANDEQVIVLYLENNMNEPLDGPSASANGAEPYAAAAAILDDVFGDLLYTPADHAEFLGAPFTCNSGHPLEASIEALRASGKRLYIHTEGCDAGWATRVFNMNANNRHTQSASGDLTAFSETGMCGGFDRVTHRNRWTRYFEDGTLVGAATGASDTELGSAEEFRGMVRCGVNMPSLDHVTPSDPRLQSFVWSWEPGQPAVSSDLNCASHSADSRFFAADCSVPKPYACAKVANTNNVGSQLLTWAIAQPAGVWRSTAACPAGYLFAVPRNGFENELLRIAKENAGISEVWLNYTDANVEGDWRTAPVTDGDGDGVPDGVDTCPAVAGPASNNGCPIDTVPNAFSFTSVSGVSQNTTVSSNVVTITGIDFPASITVEVGEYRINGGAYTSANGTITNGQTVQVRHASAATANTVTETSLNIGGVVGKFRSTTAAGGTDTDPDAFNFPTKLNQPPSALVASNLFKPIGYTAATTVKAGAGTEYSINCTEPFTAAPGTISPGTSICVRHTTAASANTLRKTSLQIGKTVGYFSTRTSP